MRVDNGETIVAVATPIGRGAISQIRLSGPQALRITCEHFSGSNLKQRRATFGRFTAGGRIIDQVVVVVYKGPQSYTGEDFAEISCHGNPLICRKIVETCLDSGARLAEPGEFTYRAFLNGKIDLTQAEAVSDLVESQTDFQLQVARRQLGGALSAKLRPLRDRLIEVIIQLETAIEFVEEDLTTTSKEQLQEELQSIRSELIRLAGTFRHGRVLQEGIKVVLAGPPNSGKSSIFNKLLKYERAIVTPYAGTTRDTLLEKLDIDGIPVLLVDTAGIRENPDPVEEEGVSRSRQNLADADLILFVLDCNRKWTRSEELIWKEIREYPCLLVQNKIDLQALLKVPDSVRDRVLNEVRISAREETNLSELSQEIVRAAVPDWKGPQSQGVMVTHLRHQQALSKGAEKIRLAQDAFYSGLSEEFIIYDLKKALDSLGEITGETTTEDILDKIFSTFCIGK